MQFLFISFHFCAFLSLSLSFPLLFSNAKRGE
jgi:hypothetical protein